MIPLTNEERKLHRKQKVLQKNIIKLEIIVIALENIEDLLIIFAIKIQNTKNIVYFIVILHAIITS